MKRHIIHAILIACNIAAGIVVANACVPVEPAYKSAQEFANNVGGVLGKLEGARAQRFLDFVNKIPPESDDKADWLLVVVVEGKGARFAVIESGCVTNVYTIDWNIFTRAMAAADSEVL